MVLNENDTYKQITHGYCRWQIVYEHKKKHTSLIRKKSILY